MTTAKLKPKERGCKFCPLNKVPGTNKVKNLERVTGKKIMVWAQNPGEQENTKRLELVGPAGELLWSEAARFGIKRSDCDIQNVVRCWTVDVNDLGQRLKPREPSKQELHCCSLYTEEALARNSGQAQVHLVLGKVAAKALLRGEYRKDQKTFFSKKLGAWVICTFHPSYFLRGGPQSKRKEFAEALRTTASKAVQVSGPYAYIESQDYKPVSARSLQEELLTPLAAAAQEGQLVSVDIEDDWVEKENVIICVGFSWRAGMARIVFLHHPALKHSVADSAEKLAAIKTILEDPNIPKAFQHGDYDIQKMKALLGITVQGYVHDTQYSEYLRFSSRRAYGLEAIADVRFREFAGYKSILNPYRNEDGRVHFLTVPPRILVLYNGADCDLTKRIADDNRGKINEPLMRVLMYAAYPISRMEQLGPIFDEQHDEVLKAWIPLKLKQIKAELQKIAGSADFNPNAPAQVAKIVYEKFHLDRHLDAKWLKEHGYSTDKETMVLVGQYHKFPLLIIEYRALAKKESTYMAAYRKSAELHEGRLRTTWWLTGTVTCRLRSGGAKDKSKGLVNLQNIHGAKEIECLLVSDKGWREMYENWIDWAMPGVQPS